MERIRMKNWINKAVLYQIYPTSFYDGNKDGIGDFKGITEKLKYVKDLGVNAIWLNPFYKSPFMDGGYDIEDYCSVDERFGTLEDFDYFVSEAKRLKLKIIIDLVIGHTSDKHPWFIESAKDEKNRYSDYYIWTDSIFNKYKDKTIHGLYERNGGYYVNYYACQPALNYGFNNAGKAKANDNNNYDIGDGWKMRYTDERLSPLRKEIYDIIRYWMVRGVDGFRVDMANSLVKDCIYDSADEKNIEGLIWLWRKMLSKMRKEFPDIIFVSEWVNPINAVEKCGFDIDFLAHDIPCYNSLFRNEKGSNLLPSFERGYNYFSEGGRGNVNEFIEYTLMLNEHLNGKGYFSAPSGSHDQIRLAANKTEGQMKVIFSFLLTYKHIPFIYYGDEIGMTHNFSANKDGGFIRTGARTPMQWTNGKNRGFSDNDVIYLPVNNDIRQSVESQVADENSLLNTVKNLISLRKRYPCFAVDAEIKIIKCENGGYPLVFERKSVCDSALILINPSNNELDYVIDEGYNVVMSHNCEFKGEKVKIHGVSFLIMHKSEVTWK
ncbi:MAG: alpha-amylase family glycosyl hydrolase [Clostridia bacterium]|nr:alpha-amylase family glycosyl hydrolase [Clostridia bacterium]